jgi:hypothetical protein
MPESLDKIEKQMRFLSVYAMVSSILLLIALFRQVFIHLTREKHGKSE